VAEHNTLLKASMKKKKEKNKREMVFVNYSLCPENSGLRSYMMFSQYFLWTILCPGYFSSSGRQWK